MQPTLTIFHDQTEYTLPYTVHKSRRKTYAITIDEEGNIIFRVPLRATNKQILQLAEEKRHWIITHYLKICAKKNSRPVSDLSAVQRTALENRYKEAARDYIPKRVAYYLPMTGGSYTRISIRDQKTRWGSCSGKGTLSFNWRLMLAPPAILDYVIVHELCHLTHMDHSPAFWQAVGAVYPDYQNARKWLKEHGSELIL
ncbi:MAG: M48 family metallopeptidase [Roseburia sp.]|nr:M48 family metallopeptidase [Ruminococcus sp.]MCM1155010.1 M48 family metallopeptidase [Roseburia sp.]MCM1242068.1 M48 family metallopeptidase [Roseburia sp.]